MKPDNLFKKNIRKFFSLALFVAFISLFGPVAVSAQQADPMVPEFLTSVEIIPEDEFVNETSLFNLNSSGFRVYAKHLNDIVFEKIAIFVDDNPSPLDERQFDNSQNEYYLSSNTATNTELASIIESGTHKIHFAYRQEGDLEYKIYETFNISCDFDAPEGELRYETDGSAPSYLKNSETVKFLFTPSDASSDIASVVFEFNGQEFIAKSNNEGDFEYNYTVVNGVNLTNPIIKCTIRDFHLNEITKSIGTDLIIDGDAPIIEILSPVDGKSYPSGKILIKYRLGADALEQSVLVYLDGQLFEKEFIDATDSLSHKLEIYCEDLAGNLSYEVSEFFVDTTAPALLDQTELKTNYALGQEIVFSGRSEESVLAVLKLEGQSVSLAKSATTDAQGSFEFLIASETLGIGDFNLTLILTDAIGNSVQYPLGLIKIETPVASKAQETCAVLSQALNDEQRGDVSATVITKNLNKKISDDDLSGIEQAKNEGKIISASDDRSGEGPFGFVFFALLLVIALAFFAAGYYGHFLVSSARSLERENISEDLKSRKIATNGKSEKYESLLQSDHSEKSKKDGTTEDLKDDNEDKSTQVRW